MAKGLNQIKEKAILADLFVVILDGRAPLLTYNKDFDKIAPHKPRLILISKIDVSDHLKLNRIAKQLANENTDVLLVNLKLNSSKKLIMKKLDMFFYQKQKKQAHKGYVNSDLRVFVVGMPNSGKSTLINLLTGAKLKAANSPGITKTNQWISSGRFMFLDTPGILLPKLENQEDAFKLVVISAIKQEIFPLKFLFNRTYKLISNEYPNLISHLALRPSQDDNEIDLNLKKLAKSKNFSTAKEDYDYNRAMNWFVNYIKNAKITLD
ncbi:ribosome biogenesis GTPase YlqF [Mesomycoplasma conjunctivae]|uniref:ribosome biogenesis GTPase YlqF n=1 Tax=Mesomycoplasma conjunctivae TaxID=45361 RepID=UPI003DA2C507